MLDGVAVAMKKEIRTASLQTRRRSKILLQETTTRMVGTLKVSQGIGNMANKKSKRTTAAIGIEDNRAAIDHKISLAGITTSNATTETT